jgi:hypothetical protein
LTQTDSAAPGANSPVSDGRTPAGIPQAQVLVHSNEVSFEQMVLNKSQNESRSPASFSASARVIGLRRDMGLSNSEVSIAPQDIILNSGSDTGISEGMILSVARSIPILDPYRENKQKQMEIEFAQVKIIHSQDGLSVARLMKIDSLKEGIAIGTRSVLIGDYVGKFN